MPSIAFSDAKITSIRMVANLRTSRLCAECCSFDRRDAGQAFLEVVVLAHRVSAVFLCLGLFAGNAAAVCAGWLATPEARMACCTGDGPCPMHKSDSDDQGAKRVISQVEADRCCASSDRDESAPSSPSFVLTVALALVTSPVPFVVPQIAPALGTWRTVVPIAATHVPKHLLLSVFLV
jgi:hypothetical protein